MSYLKINLFKKADKHLFDVKPIRNCDFEEYIKSDLLNVYSLLNISNERLQLNEQFDDHISTYLNYLQNLLQNHTTLTYIDDNKPLVFHWLINNKEFFSTSLFFEYYMTNLMKVTQNITSAMTKKIASSNDIYKQVKTDILHLLKILPHWNTCNLIQPDIPYVTNQNFLKELLYFTHASQAMNLSTKHKEPQIALSTAINYYGKIWFRLPVLGSIAENHYNLCNALYYKALSDKTNVEESEKKYALLKEASNFYQMVEFKNCFVFDNMKEDKTFVENAQKELRSLEQVYYATGDYDIKELKKHKILHLKVCPKTQQFGCKCKQDD